MRVYSNEEIYKRRQKRQKIKDITKLILISFICLIVTYNISLIAQGIINPSKTPSFLGVKTYAIVSGSMKPEIDVGSIVIVKEEEQKNLKQGDIITFRRNSEMITHRILKIENENGEIKYITKGDNNNTRDSEIVKYKDIEGVVKKTIPKIGYIIIMLKNKFVILLILFTFCIMYLIDQKIYNKNLARQIKKEKLNIRRE